ncbi:DegT/DnrJ/EryC1/StrS family aminotransferase [Bacteroidota bacterium]
MTKDKVHPFYKSENIRNAFNKVFNEGDWWKYKSERTIILEERFAQYHDSKFGISVCNGSVALDVILKSLEIKNGDEIILPAYDYYYLPKSVINSGAVPVFADVCDNNFTLDSNDIDKRITRKTKAIIAVHISSSVAQMDRIKQIAKDNELTLIEDCAQAHGAIYGNKKVGSWGDVSLFSFGGIKLMTSGQGGMIITSNEDLYNKMFSLVNRGLLSDGSMNKFGIIGDNYQLSELQAALLLPQLEMLDEYCNKREKAIRYLDDNLKEIKGVSVLKQFEKTGRRAQMRYSFCLESNNAIDNTNRDFFIDELQKRGYSISGGHSVIRNDERLQGYFNKVGSFPNAQKAEDEIVSLYHTFLLNEFNEIDELIKDIKNIMNN